MKVSVVIPAYNEQENIKKCLYDVVKKFPEAEIIVVNDASTDDTLLELSMFNSETENRYNLKVLINQRNMGHGYSVMRGLKEATGDYILYIDADRQIELENLSKLEGNEYDFVSGYRLHRNDKLFRKVISFCLKSTNLVFHSMYIKDANCPFKLYRSEALKPLLDEVPTTYIVPIACLEVLARRHNLNTKVIATPHHPYEGVRKGFLQSFNIKLYLFLWAAFLEVVKL